ncbi:uncharacterized protein LOC126176337, partial [Schistocerca cancellata]|uniref:uncharacterized protein LOC126176337 n=1 Tax=Schistocerca cancellata TaxID=274614 RepID=UPI0021181B54
WLLTLDSVTEYCVLCFLRYHKLYTCVDTSCKLLSTQFKRWTRRPKRGDAAVSGELGAGACPAATAARRARESGHRLDSGNSNLFWRIQLDQDLFDTIIAIYPEWFKDYQLQLQQQQQQSASGQGDAAPSMAEAEGPGCGSADAPAAAG